MGAQDHLHCTDTGHVSSQTIMYQQDRSSEGYYTKWHQWRAATLGKRLEFMWDGQDFLDSTRLYKNPVFTVLQMS